MTIEQWISQIDLESGIILLTILLVGLALILLLNRGPLLLRWREWQLQRGLDRIGCEQIRGLVCDDGLDGTHEIDRLALVDDAILIIAYKPYRGNIYCAEQIDEWTQVIGQKSFKFRNPIYELENQIASLRLIVGNTPIRGYLYFGQGAAFPKGHPNVVLHPENLPAAILTPNCSAPRGELAAAWLRLKAHRNGASPAEQIDAKT